MRKEKQLLLNEIKEKIESSPAFYIAHYQGISANATNLFRAGLRKVGGELEVVRKRVFLKAMQEAGIEIPKGTCEGHIGIIFASDDPVPSAKVLVDQCKELETQLSVLAGFFERKLLSAAEVEALSKLPSLDVMRSQFIGLLEAPMAQTLAVFDALLTSIIHCMDNKVQKDSEE